MYTRSESHFVNIPANKISHSRLDLSHYNTTSFNVGDLIPLTEPIEVLPGDSFNVDVGSMVRLTTLIVPFMDNLFMDVCAFYVPFRLLWEHYVNFCGENDSTPWVSDTTYSMPQITAPDGGWKVGSIADYMRIPVNVPGLEINALPFRAYAKVVKDWWYDENNQYPPDFLIDDATIAGSNGDNYVTDLIKGGMPFIVGKTHDIMTSCLPSPQKGSSVVLPLGDNAPVYFGPEMSFDIFKSRNTLPISMAKFFSPDDSEYQRLNGNLAAIGVSGSVLANQVVSTGLSPGVPNGSPVITNAYADTSLATATTVNDLRVAFQTQRLLELMARGGSRYYETLANEWGISAPQGIVQRSEYLGGFRFNLNVETVPQTSGTTDVSPQGNLAAYSCTVKNRKLFNKAFNEAGVILILGCVRYQHTYSQGLPKLFKRKDKFDFYHNAFAHIGEQGIKNYQIYAQGNEQDDEIFGYNEAWVEYRYLNNGVTGELRPNVTGNQDFWTFADKFDSLPTLSSEFIKESKSNVDRVLAVSSSLTNQLRGEFNFKINAIRPLPLYSIPGLIDHM